ncbi:NAD(P)/FAD-dependent oxidoreductase [Limibacter armeniacum]|uniref:phytoene desaturase family protein n=1 Tax=Limibacter armeniacum TaxID=466084 RepID=UPI002FE55E36
MPQSYKKQKPDSTYDYVIIGSGISGIGLAAILGKEGFRCVVLERHYTPGGYTHVFTRRGYEWDVGIHYVGEVHREGSTTSRLMSYISDGTLRWEEMDEEYDRIYLGDEKVFGIRKGIQNYKASLYNEFPDEKHAIDQYFELLKQAGKATYSLFMRKGMPGMLKWLFGNSMKKRAAAFEGKTTREVLEGITQNETLIGVLTGQYGDYGLPPSESSFLMHTMLVTHYFNGGSYPVGGSSSIYKSIEPVIQQYGGAVYINAEVKELWVEKNKAKGVVMVDGNRIKATKGVISSAGFVTTYEKLIPPYLNIPKPKVLEEVKPSSAHLCLYVGMNGSAEELQLTKTNFWIYPGVNHDTSVEAYRKDQEEAALPVIYISFPAAKDPDWQMRYPGKSTLEIITISDYEYFKEWENQPWKKRGEAYEHFKEQLSQKLLEALYEKLPQLRGKVDYYELSTPLSTAHFMNYTKGEIYGLNHTPERFYSDELNVKTPIKNFYMTGQDLISCGFAGSLSAAYVTASYLRKKNMFKKAKK